MALLLSKCPYCDFNSHVSAKVDHARWRAALTEELRYFKTLVPERRVSSIFFGGGTPSLMEPETVDAVISEIRWLWPWTNQVEITLEANPTSVDADRFAAFRQPSKPGFPRHPGPERQRSEVSWPNPRRSGSQRAIGIARNTFERMSFDLIYARPGQTVDTWRTELKEALNLAADHIRFTSSLSSLGHRSLPVTQKARSHCLKMTSGSPL